MDGLPKLGAESDDKIEPQYKKIGENIARAREARGISQAELGQEIGKGASSIAEIEGGTQRILVHDIDAIAKGLSIMPRSLMVGLWY